MFGMLQIVFRRDAIPGHTGIARHLQIFLQNLMRITPDANIRAVAVIGLITLAGTATMRTAHTMRFTLATSAATAVVVALFHRIVTSSFR